VRDPLAWSGYINEAIEMFGEAEAMVGQHHWPVWGREKIRDYLAKQRDLYKYVHDQTLRLMNHGMTASEIAEEIKLPAALAQVWQNRDYYGAVKHNVKAIYQRYLGWYDANPANLDGLPPV
ncbi:MAG: MBL fold metallo-hydrolase, partial [Hyphomicrobiales bacterium]|nr:MBL fold metallo-hydrolase [Hyphomicrobiales bacterium]